MQFQVPQFTETEAKVVGPLTLKQFIYIAAAAVISFLLYAFVQTWLWIMISIPLLVIGIALAFIKINGRSFTGFLVSFFNFYWQPQKYVWQTEAPNLPKTESAMQKVLGEGFSLENLVAGIALKKVWQDVQTGSKTPTMETVSPQKVRERYEIVRRLTGERKAAKRIDYR